MNSQRMTGMGPLLFVVLLLGLLAGGRSRFFKDPGTFWHTATGEHLLQTRTFLTTDPFTYTFGGQPWTPYEWLGEVAMALLNRLGGFDLLLLTAITIVAGTFAALGARIARTGLHWAAAVCLTGLGVAAAASHFHVRPHLVTMTFLAIVMMKLAAVESGRASIRSLLWLVPLVAVWSNIHGGAAGGVATIELVIAGWLGCRLLSWESPVKTWSDAITAIGISVAIACSVLVNPYGLALPKTWLAIMSMPEVKEIIIEHMPIDLRDPASAPFFLLGAIYAFLLLGLRRPPRATWLIPIVWFVLGCDRVRHASLFTIVALTAIADLLPQTRWADWLAKWRPDYYIPVIKPLPWNWRSLALPILSVALIFGIQQSGSTLPVVGHGWAKLDETVWPVELVEPMKKEAAGRTGLRLFNEINAGGFAIWFLPEYRTFVDDRCEVFGGAWLKEITDADRIGSKASREFLCESQSQFGRFDYALTRIGSGFDECFAGNSEWDRIAKSESFAFYRRQLR